MSSVLSAAYGPSSHAITSAERHFLAAPIWSATTATASSNRTIWRTPRTDLALLSSTLFSRPPNTGDCASVAMWPRIDAEHGAAVDLRRGVEPLSRCADQLEILRPLQRDFFRHRQGRGVVRQRAIPQTAIACGVNDVALLGVTRCRVDIPAPGGRHNQHGAGGGPSLSQRLPDPTDGGRPARPLP